MGRTAFALGTPDRSAGVMDGSLSDGLLFTDERRNGSAALRGYSEMIRYCQALATSADTCSMLDAKMKRVQKRK